MSFNRSLSSRVYQCRFIKLVESALDLKLCQSSESTSVHAVTGSPRSETTLDTLCDFEGLDEPLKMNDERGFVDGGKTGSSGDTSPCALDQVPSAPSKS